MDKQELIKNIPFSEPHLLVGLVEYQKGRVVSLTFAENSALSLTLFAFDRGQGPEAEPVARRDVIRQTRSTREAERDPVSHLKVGQFKIRGVQDFSVNSDGASEIVDLGDLSFNAYCTVWVGRDRHVK